MSGFSFLAKLLLDVEMDLTARRPRMAALVETIDILTLSDLTPIENVRKM
jgi:hypothetical protein